MTEIRLSCKDIIEGAHSDAIWSLKIVDKTLITGSVDQTIKTWDLETNLSQNFPEVHQLGVVSLDANDSVVCSLSLDGLLAKYDLQTRELLISKSIESGWKCRLNPSGTIIAVGCQNGQILMLNAETLDQLFNVSTFGGCIMSLTFSKSGIYFAVGTYSGEVYVFESESGRLFRKFQSHSMPVRSVAFTDDDLMLYSGSDDSRINLFNVSHGHLTATFTGHTSWVTSVVPHPYEPLLASSSTDGTVRIWDLNTKNCQDIFDHQKDPVWDLSWCTELNYLCSVTEQGGLRVFQLLN